MSWGMHRGTFVCRVHRRTARGKRFIDHPKCPECGKPMVTVYSTVPPRNDLAAWDALFADDEPDSP